MGPGIARRRLFVRRERAWRTVLSARFLAVAVRYERGTIAVISVVIAVMQVDDDWLNRLAPVFIKLYTRELGSAVYPEKR
jgi:hypothetical protein